MVKNRNNRPKILLLGSTLFFLWLLAWSYVTDVYAGKVLRLATTTSTENSGLTAAILPRFEADNDTVVQVIAVGTGKALQLGRNGDVDLVLVHAREQELQFVNDGYGVDRREVMYNDFVIIGPESDPAKLALATNAIDAMVRIAQQKSLFVSRGDESGTHLREKQLWRNGDVELHGDWYREAGQGMGKVLQIANELQAYTLTDRGTWLAYRGNLDLTLLFENDPPLHNRYGVIAVNPEKFPQINYTDAKAMIDWLTSTEGQNLIADYQIDGERLFKPLYQN